jgi:hypothetical protein
MKTYPTFKEPFAFWLARQFLAAEDHQEETIHPIRNREFYGAMSMVIVTIIVLNMLFRGLSR